MPTANLWMSAQPITSHYGNRSLSGRDNYHKGVDFAFGLGAEVSAWGDGIVSRAGRYTGGDYPERGIFVEIQHAGRDILTSYHSLDRVAVKVGQRVKRGETIGYAGRSATGATGPHLHGGLWLGGRHVDPLKYLAPGQTRAVTYGSPSPAAVAPAAPVTPISVPERKKKMYLTWSTTGTGYLVTEDGYRGLPSMQYYDLFKRLLKSTPEAPDTFNPTEIDMMNSILRDVSRAGLKEERVPVTVDAGAIAQAVVVAVQNQLKDVKVDIDEQAIAQAVNDGIAKRMAA